MVRKEIVATFITNKIVVKYSLFAIMLLSANCPDLTNSVNKIQVYKTRKTVL